MTDIIQKNFEGTPVSFSINGQVYVDAAAMANRYGKQVKDYTRTQRAKDLIASLESKLAKYSVSQDPQQRVGKANSPFENVFLQESNGQFKAKYTIKGGAYQGTWMHKYLAYDFAGWLDADFSLWMIETVDNMVKQQYEFAINYTEDNKELRYLKEKMQLARDQAENTTQWRYYEECKKEYTEKKKYLKDIEEKHMGVQLRVF